MPDTTPVSAVLSAAEEVKKAVLDGHVGCDPNMRVVRAVRDAGLFYLDIDSPNGRYGTMRLTTYGRRAQAAFRAAALKASAEGVE